MTVPPRRAALTAMAAALTAGALVAGCGSGPGSGAGTLSPVAAPPAPATPPATTVPGAPSPAAPVALPWPVAGSSQVAELQSQVDSGAQPWLLDPTEVGMSFAAAAHGWNDTTATRDGATAVTVRAADGRRLLLTVVQPGRSGPGGIWVVTAETPA